jgi:ATP-dependent helicase HrpA
MNPYDLPVYKQKEKILDQLKENQVIVVESPTGSGKTTQIPQILFNTGYAKHGIIGITQPRRIAAVSVSEYIAKQLNTTIPNTIGYKMRFDDKTDASTKIKIMTDGILLQEIKLDYNLMQYSMIMVDEAHERSLNIDFILGLLKRIIRARPEFQVIISSATINAEVFSAYFDDCPIVKIDTTTYPVATYYWPLENKKADDELLSTITHIVEKCRQKKQQGGILIFLPGEKAIKECISRLHSLNKSKELEILPLYARLSSQEQENIFNKYGGKIKIIVATNIAETSVTIDGITTVIDSGLSKLNYYNQRTFTSSLIEGSISKASCNQRKGRSGRTGPGFCYRLYSKEDYESRPLFTLEEIFRTDLSEVVLRMAEIGIKDFENFDFISPPGKQGIISAVETLELLDAIDANRDLTYTGKMMIHFPLLPKHSRIIIESIQKYPDVLEEVLIATSFLTTSTPFLLPQGEEMAARKAHHTFRDKYGDFLSYIKIFKAYTESKNKEKFCKGYYLDPDVMLEICNIKKQLEEIVSGLGIPVSSGGRIEDYLSAISRGLIQFVCTRTGRGVYRTLTAGKIQIHPGSVMFNQTPSYIVAGEIVQTTRMYARSVSRLEPQWLKRISPLLYENLVKPGRKAVKFKTARDFTNRIKIGTGIFQIKKEKGKKMVYLPWEILKKQIQKIDIQNLPNFKGLKGKIIYQKNELLAGARINSILYISKHIDIDNCYIKNYPRENFPFPESAERLCSYLDKLLYISQMKKKSRYLGFLSLHTNSGRIYWFKCIKSFYNAVAQSLSSLETLADESAENVSEKNLYKINSAYRRLTDIIK